MNSTKIFYDLCDRNDWICVFANNSDEVQAFRDRKDITFRGSATGDGFWLVGYTNNAEKENERG